MPPSNVMQLSDQIQDGVTPTPSDFTEEETAKDVLATDAEMTTPNEDEDEEMEQGDMTDEEEEDDSEPLKVTQGNKYVVFSFIRHGESRENTEAVPPNEGDVLTHQGREQAETLGKSWADIRIDALYSSDLNRARDTAINLSKFNRCHPDVKLTSALKEKDHGRVYARLKEQGRFAEAKRVRRGGHKGPVPRTFRPEGGGESYDDVLDRGLAILLRLTKKYGVDLPRVPKELGEDYQPTGEIDELPDDIPHVVLVSHNIFLSQLYKALSTWNEDNPDLPHSKYNNTGWTRHLIRLGSERTDEPQGPLDRQFHFDFQIKHLRWIELADSTTTTQKGTGGAR